MKKIILLFAAILLSLSSYSQAGAATASLQTVANATATIIKQKLDSISQWERAINTKLASQATAVNQTLGTAAVNLVKGKLDTTNQSERRIFKGIDTLNQSIRSTNLAISDKTVSGTIAAINNSVTLSNKQLMSTVGIQITGTYTGILSIQGSIDGTNWVTFNAAGNSLYDWNNSNATQNTIGSGVTGIFRMNSSGVPYIRVIGLGAMTGTANVSMYASDSPVSVHLQGANSNFNLGNVTISSVLPGVTASSLGKAEDQAHASADVGVMALGVQYSNIANPATTNDYSFISLDDMSKTITSPYTHPANMKNAISSAITTTTSTQIFPSAGASARTYITSIAVNNDNTTATTVNILDGSTVIFRVVLPASLTDRFYTFPVPIRCSAATAVNAQCGTAGANVYVQITGYSAL